MQECAKAKSPEDLDIAAKDFAKLIKQGGVELTVTLATAGVSQLGKISRAGGAVVGYIERGTIAAYNKIGKVTDEILTGMRRANGDNLAYETATIRPVVNQADDAASASVKQATAKPAQTADDLVLEMCGEHRINIRKSNGTTGSGMEYAWKKHGGGGTSNKSQFSISRQELETLLQRKDVVKTPLTKDALSGNYIGEVDVGYEIGKVALNKGGQPTSVITIITDEAGNLVNVFPGRLGFGAK